MPYTRQGPFTEDGPPGLTGARLNAMEDGIADGVARAEAAASALVFSVRKTVNQLTPAAGAVVLFDEEEWDVGGWHDPATGRYTPQKAGYYRVGAGIRLQGIANARWARVTLMKNGGAHKTLWSDFNGSGGNSDLIGSGSVVVFANGTTDFFTVRADHNDSADRMVYGVAANPDTFFQGEFIGT